jgi:hypothetical protein
VECCWQSGMNLMLRGASEVVCDVLSRIDFLLVMINFNYRAMYILVLYIPPNSHDLTYKVFCDLLMSLHFLYDSNLLIVGDFNVPDYVSGVCGHSRASTSCQLLNNLISFYDLKQCNNVRNNNNRLLDLVFVSRSVIDSGDPLVGVDDHHPSLEVGVTYVCSKDFQSVEAVRSILENVTLLLSTML